MKKCSKCKVEKPISEFHKRNNRPLGLKSSCKQCVNESNKNSRKEYSRSYDLKRSYNISLDQYNDMFNKQNGCCAICKKHISELDMKRKKNLCVDHCHETDKIRGLLCDKCNRGIGLLKDSIEVLESAIYYLKESYQHAPKAVEGFIHDKNHGQVARLTHLF
jgi:hypothetical protein